MQQELYPQKPDVEASSIVIVSSRFKSQVIRVLLSIFLFIIGYLTVLAIALGLIYYGGIVAITVVSLKFSWITVLLGLGIMLTVIMFFVFIVKFLFKIKKDESPNRVEVTAVEQPDLFEFIQKVCNEANAPFPKKIFLSPDVNASVFYNSSFLSMFFPVRKNLEIGLGLINVLNISEFKAVIAHEFGHFSQSSTKLGIYVYRFNKMIYNLIYDNNGWEESLASMSSLHAILTLFAQLTILLAKGAIWVFVKLYELINLSYMSLSREMEFHADLVAVSVSGSESIINALYRVEFGAEAYNTTLFYTRELYENEKKLPRNFFKMYLKNISLLSRQNNLTLKDNLPVINFDIYKNIVVPNRVIIENAWASHPEITERKKNAFLNFVPAIQIDLPAYKLLKNIEKIELDISSRIYINLLEIKEKERLEDSFVNNFVDTVEQKNAFHPAYCGFYNVVDKTAVLLEGKDVIYDENIAQMCLEELFSYDIVYRIKKIHRLITDVDLIRNISQKKIRVKKFEFDDKLYNSTMAEQIYGVLQKELQIEEEWLMEHKKKITLWFYSKLKTKDENLAKAYHELNFLRIKMFSDVNLFIHLFNQSIEFYYKIQNVIDSDHEPLRTQLKEYYNSFTKLKNEIQDVEIPAICLDNKILNKGYKQLFFEFEVRATSDALVSLTAFLDDMQKLINHIHEIDLKIFKLTINLQNNIVSVT